MGCILGCSSLPYRLAEDRSVVLVQVGRPERLPPELLMRIGFWPESHDPPSSLLDCPGREHRVKGAYGVAARSASLPLDSVLSS
ncbi:hypothetical protein Misp01_30130 [Microtetraspora sp. NBRC 13810]|nr:hypothetical protein Misp01_30130 [Microtetraspora sp. NBRC 13810]